ncbi:protein containing Phage antirepressor protein domain [Pseudovibrio sp. FO-BEG1]|uniref:phage antirepressor KilAC domain-containing protein n=1 Tax=Pseudovibrio sp. (strain FO-BEG1) TaxID=911045 RepID=UPI000238D648|nr:phage antirepressor KilAC domain-containing protein [Pseudovibrio sp. FO-BEG1]AEV35257.1 protein containing Phage antirepressor protein domain [Pseudovibrio sp. FO-BEG1]
MEHGFNLPLTLGTSHQDEITMTSLEIARLCNKKHHHIRRDIESMIDDLPDVDLSSFGYIYHDAYGRAQQCYKLPRDLVMTLISGYSVPLRHAIVTRLAELEAKAPAPLDFNDPDAMARYAVEQGQAFLAQKKELQETKQQVEMLEEVVEESAQSVKFVDTYVSSSGLINIRDTAKLLEANERYFINWLVSTGIMFRGANRVLMPKKIHITAGRFKVKAVPRASRSYNQSLFTNKGFEWISKLWRDRAKHR